MKQKSFEEIGKDTKTDKISHHGFHRFYPLFLEHLRSKALVMLEIGVYKGESLKIWEKYFPKAIIYGLDIKKGYKFKRGEVFKGDQSDLNILSTVIDKIGNRVDFIIDDGSHKPEHQITTFNFLFAKFLKPGGVYIIEDVETSYWAKGVCHGYTIKCGYKNRNNVVNIFKQIVDGINKEFIKKDKIVLPDQVPQDVIGIIELISFQYNSIIIMKKDKNSKKFENRKYRFDKYL